MAYNSSSLDSFICYYLFLGFSTLYLYLDDAADATFQIARRYPADRVRVRLRDASLRIEWERMPSWTRLVLCADTEVQARQLLNCEHAIARIRAQAAPRDEWLLHIDSDELLFLPAAAADLAAARVSDALQGHLAYLEKLGAILFTYRNLEGVPEALTCDDALRSISLFKEHPSRLDERVPAVARAVRYWTSASNAGGELFRFYTNGKSIVRVQDAVTTAVSVHEWSLPSKQVAAAAGFTNNAQLCHSSYVFHQVMQTDEAGGAVLLHFAVCSFDTFWRKNWAALGYASPNHRFRGGGGGIDLRSCALSRQNRHGEAEALYRRSMMVCNADELTRQLSSGVCLRVDVGSLVAAGRAALMPSIRTPSHVPLPTLRPSLEHLPAATLAPPPWLTEEARASMTVAERSVREQALAAVRGDALLVEFASKALDEAIGQAHAMAAEAAAADEGLPCELARRRLTLGPAATTARGSGDATRDNVHVGLFACVLPRAARNALLLLPLARMRFDLSGCARTRGFGGASWATNPATPHLTPSSNTPLLHPTRPYQHHLAGTAATRLLPQ